MRGLFVKSNCCTSNHPPSPDGLGPRPIPSLVSAGKRPSKDHIPSWVTVDATELQAIFEDADAADLCRAKHVTHKAIPAPGELSDLDKYDSDKLYVLAEQVEAKKSSNALKAVTQKLKKALSKEGELSKRHSRSSVGTSEEEIERRAELRRIRERRIREELSNEGIYDDDAVSVPSMPGTPLKNDRASAWIPGNFVPLPCLTPPVLDMPMLPYPALDPLEVAHQALQDSESASEKMPRRLSNPISSSVTMVNSSRSLSRRFSSPVLSDWEIESDNPNVYVPSRKTSLLPQIPGKPIILPQRLPSITDPFPSAWRLSFAVENRGELLRKLSQSQGNAIPVTLSPNLLADDKRPAGSWLLSQGLRSPSPVILGTINLPSIECSTTRVTCSADQDFGGVDGGEDDGLSVHLHEEGLHSEDDSPPFHLHEMGIPDRLAPSRGITSMGSSPQLSSSEESHQKDISSINNTFPGSALERPRFMRYTSESIALSERVPQSWGQVVHDYTSSVYPSGDVSLQHSQESSFRNLLSLFPSNRSRIDGPKGNVHSASLVCLSKSPTANLSTASLTVPLSRTERHLTVDDNSLVTSETESFRQREAELIVVQTRFAASEAGQIRNSPVSSKFIEEFDDKPEEHLGTLPRKKSLFDKLARLAVKSYDGESRMEELPSIPMPKFNPEELRRPSGGRSPGGALLSPGGFLSPTSELDDPAALWSRALKGDTRTDNVATNLHIPHRTSTVIRKKSAISDEPKGAFATLISLRRGKKKKVDMSDHKSAAEEYNQRFEERLAVKELVMDSWEDEIAATAAKAKAKSRTIVKKSKPNTPDRRYPATWSRFDSASREARVNAGALDRVDIKDFANLGKATNGEIMWCLEHDDSGHHDSITEARAGLGHKMADKIRHKAYKLDTSDEQYQQTNGRRGSLTVAGDLEYPELEVLPYQMKTAEELAAEVQAEREAEERRWVEEQKKRLHVPKLAVRHRSAADGSADEDQGENNISTADPRFYNDCIVNPSSEYHRKTSLRRSKTDGAVKKDKFKTWSGKDWDGYVKREGVVSVYGSKRDRTASMQTQVLREGEVVDERAEEMEKMERAERERILGAAVVAGSES